MHTKSFSQLAEAPGLDFRNMNSKDLRELVLYYFSLPFFVFGFGLGHGLCFCLCFGFWHIQCLDFVVANTLVLVSAMVFALVLVLVLLLVFSLGFVLLFWPWFLF